MSLDSATGVLTWDDGERIDPRVPLAEAGFSAPLRVHASWKSFALPRRLLDGVEFGATLTFEGERLASIDLHLPRAGNDGYDSWSLAEEKDLAAQSARWLAHALPGSRRKFPWGTASAGFDERSASAYLIIRYEVIGL